MKTKKMGQIRRSQTPQIELRDVYIVDAVNYLFRSYYAIGPMTNAQGQSTSALYGFIRSVQKLIKEFSPEYLVCVFDGPDNKRSRQAVFADYKMHRKRAPEDLFPQFAWAEEFCRLAGIPTLCIEGVEADDAMASVAVWAQGEGATSFLCTSDKDLMQLVGDKTFVLHPAKDYLKIDKAKVEELFGVRPEQMLDFLAIMGDASDNIPGLEGFGPKTAAALLQEFGTLDAILAHPEKVKGAKKQEILRTQRDQALLSRQLATLDTAVDVPKEREFYRIRSDARASLTEFYHTMQFNTLLRESGGEKAQLQESGVANYHLVETKAELGALLQRLAQQPEVGIDVETTSEQPLLAELVGIGFCCTPKEAWYVPYQDAILPQLKAFFSTTSCGVVGHNLKYDLHVLQNYDISIRHIAFDTLLASYLLNPQNRRHNLDDLTLEIFQKVKIPITDLIGKGKQQITMREVPVDKVKEYCSEDIDYTMRLKHHFAQKLQEQGLFKLFHEVELPLLPILAKMERVGIFLDADKLRAQGEALVGELEQLQQTIFSAVGEEFNLNSPKQLSEVLFQKLGLRKPARARTEFATSADVLEELAEEHLIVHQILEYRTLEKLRTTYIEALPLAIHPKTGRIHCTFNQSVTATGRLSCQNPNLQNIPVRTREGLAIRSCFQARPGWSFVGADYSQIELRLLAHFSQDPQLMRAFQSKEDIHTYTASLIFNVPMGTVTSEMRAQAKTVNFGILYGQGPFSLAKQLHISHTEASQFIKVYFERYPRILDTLESFKNEVRSSGASKTLTGRQRPIPEIHNKNAAIRAAAERLAINTPLQGTAADLIKMAMIAIDQATRELQGSMILQIHDELICEVPDSEIQTFTSIVKKKMETVMALSVPLEVTISVGKNWAEC